MLNLKNNNYFLKRKRFINHTFFKYFSSMIMALMVGKLHIFVKIFTKRFSSIFHFVDDVFVHKSERDFSGGELCY